MASISLNQVRTDDRYNFQSIYDDIETSPEDNDSPYEDNSLNCDYWEAEELKKFSSNQQATSFFHVNCRSLSANWDSFKNLLCDLHSDSFKFNFWNN